MLRLIRRVIWDLAPNSRERDLRTESRFWHRWLASEGLEWPEDYQRRFDPDAPVQDHLAPFIGRLAGHEIDILDVGSGPLTKVGRVHGSKRLSITAVDVLADTTTRILNERGLTPPVMTRYADAQNLREKFGAGTFDIVHAQNSLDHMSDPMGALEEMFRVTKPGGFVVLLHAENEGRNQCYWALHKWDFTCGNGRFIIKGPGSGGPRCDVTELFSGRADVECTLDDGAVLVAIRKRAV